MKKLILLRGPSGTGKSTVASAMMRDHIGNARISKGLNMPTAVRVEADTFHTKRDGTYAFDLDRLSNSHKWCQLTTEFHMFQETELVIVSNTSISRKECQTYIDLALRYGYEWDIVRTPGPWDIELMDKRNTHDLSRVILDRQLSRYVPFAEETEWSDMSVFA